MGIGARNLQVPTYAQVQGEIGRHSPVILEKEPGLPPAVCGFDGIAEIDKIHAAEEEAGGGSARTTWNRNGVAVGETGSVERGLRGLEGKAAIRDRGFVALQPSHFAAHGEVVPPADDGHVVVDDVAVLGDRRSTYTADAVLHRADADAGIRAVLGERRHASNSQRRQPWAGSERTIQEVIANEADVQVIQQCRRMRVSSR